VRKSTSISKEILKTLIQAKDIKERRLLVHGERGLGKIYTFTQSNK
jgi:hypothetical protein